MTDAPGPPPLNLDETMLCACCGYDLGGGGPAGRCPECGAGFDRATGRNVRRASERAGRSPGANRAWGLTKVAGWLAAAVAALAAGGAASVASATPRRPLLTGLGFAAAFAAAAFVTWRGERSA